MSRKPLDSPGLWAACDYALRGWPAFPLGPGSKIPLTKNGFYDATCDLGQINEWWARRPDANVGIRTGVAFDVIDFDTPEAYAEHVDAVDGPTVITARGAHVYVLPGRGRSRPGLRPGIDFKAGGGYVVAPPSVHPSGVAYVWLDGFGPDYPLGPAPVLSEDETAPVPPRTVSTSVPTGDRPGDVWNAQGDVGAVLERNGWRLLRVQGRNEHWVRPGKAARDGCSATFDLDKRCLYVFTSAAPEFEPGRGYAPFEVLTRLEYRGDHSAAARALREVMA